MRALGNVESDLRYLDFFGLRQAPFNRDSSPTEIFHSEQYSTLFSHLRTAADHPDCLVVVCGADGSGRSTLLDHYASSLSDDDLAVFIDESCRGEKEFLCTFLNQLGFGDISGSKGELHRIAKEFLVHRSMAGDHALLIIDNAHMLQPSVLEQLRWLAAIKVGETRVLSVILSGNSDLVMIMDSPAMSQLAFRTNIRFHIRAFTEQETADYIWHRLKLANATDAIAISNTAYPLIHRYSRGIPGLINVLCNAVLEEAHARRTPDITDELIREIADRQQLLPHVMSWQGTGRRKSDPDVDAVHGPNRPANHVIDNPDADSANEGPSQGYAGKLLQRISRLSQQVGELGSDNERALDNIDTRDATVTELRQRIEAERARAEKLAGALANNTGQMEKLTTAMSDSTHALQESQELAKKLAIDLTKEKAKTKVAQDELATATAALEASDRQLADMQDLGKDRVRSENEICELECKLSDAVEAIDALVLDLEQANAQLTESATTHESSTELDDENKQMSAELRSAKKQLKKLKDVHARNEELEALVEKLQQREPEPEIVPSADISVLEIIKDGQVECIVDFDENQRRIMIGRNADNDLVLDSAYVSRHHAVIVRTKDGPYIEDLNSNNGTFVNSREIKRHDLHLGDLVTIGDFQIRPGPA